MYVGCVVVDSSWVSCVGYQTYAKNGIRKKRYVLYACPLGSVGFTTTVGRWRVPSTKCTADGVSRLGLR